MAPFNDNLLRELDKVLIAIRNSIDAAAVSGTMGSMGDAERRRVYFKFEEMRFDFRSVSNAPRDDSFANTLAVVRLVDSIGKLLKDHEFLGSADRIHYRPAPSNPKNPARFLKPSDYTGRMSVADALSNLQFEIGKLPFPPRLKPNLGFIDFVSTQMPQQQGVAPLHFKFVDGRLALAHRRANPDLEDLANAEVARDKLLRDGNRLVSELRNSNCDPRLTETFSELATRLSTRQDIVALGITCMACQMMQETFADELPDAVNAMCTAQITGTAMYLAQFREWQRFVDQANALQLGDAQIRAIDSAAAAVVRELQAKPNTSYPEVPEALDALRQILGRASPLFTKKAALAVWASLQNLVIKICGHGKDFMVKVGKKTGDKLATATANAIVYGVLGVALVALMRMAPVSAAIEGSGWVKQGVEVLRKEIDELASRPTNGG